MVWEIIEQPNENNFSQHCLKSLQRLMRRQNLLIIKKIHGKPNLRGNFCTPATNCNWSKSKDNHKRDYSKLFFRIHGLFQNLLPTEVKVGMLLNEFIQKATHFGVEPLTTECSLRSLSFHPHRWQSFQLMLPWFNEWAYASSDIRRLW